MTVRNAPGFILSFLPLFNITQYRDPYSQSSLTSISSQGFYAFTSIAVCDLYDIVYSGFFDGYILERLSDGQVSDDIRGSDIGFVKSVAGNISFVADHLTLIV